MLAQNLPRGHSAEFLIIQNFEVDTNLQSKSIRSDVQCINWVQDQAGPAQSIKRQGLETSLRSPSEFLVEHWQELDFESLAPIGQSVKIDTEFNSLKVKIPEHLEEEYNKAARPCREVGNLVMSLVLKIEDEKN